MTNKKKASEPTDIVGFDEFDPRDLAAAEAKEQERPQMEEEIAKGYLERRRLAYAAVFSKGHTDQADIDIVINDLAWFCRAYAPTYDVREGGNANDLMKIKEGRREVFNRVLDHTRLDREAVFVKYTNAITK